jgi:ketosteroid isomerase-like protein
MIQSRRWIARECGMHLNTENSKECEILKNYFNYLLCAVFSLVLISCDRTVSQTDKDAELKEIAGTVDACIGWFKDKDFDLLFSVVAHDSNYISVHPSDRVIKGYAQFEENSEIFKRPEFQYVRHELKDLNINISKSGDTAWWYCILDDINTWDGQPANWENARWTGVLEKRAGRWVIVQQHFSFAAE